MNYNKIRKITIKGIQTYSLALLTALMMIYDLVLGHVMVAISFIMMVSIVLMHHEKEEETIKENN